MGSYGCPTRSMLPGHEQAAGNRHNSDAVQMTSANDRRKRAKKTAPPANTAVAKT